MNKLLCSLACTWITIIDSQCYSIDKLLKMFHLNEMLTWWLPCCIIRVTCCSIEQNTCVLSTKAFVLAIKRTNQHDRSFENPMAIQKVKTLHFLFYKTKTVLLSYTAYCDTCR